MRKIITLKVAGKDVHLPKLIGAFILFAALFMFIKGTAEMFDSWDNLKYAETCLASVDVSAPIIEQEAAIQECRDTLYNNTGIYLKLGQGKPTSRQFWSVLLGPIASVLFWLAVLFIGWILYKTGELVVPIEETVKEVREVAPKVTAKKKKK